MQVRKLNKGESFINSNSCQYDKNRKALYTASEVFGGGFPRRILVISSHTKREVWFNVVQPGHPLYDEDQWDGEMQVYVPEVDLPNVEKLTVCHEF